ncbi:hypothetical protein HPB49_008998 [Dermacentor silvarum]|uniref:Uncharacterized protein n=1 Tax=Dermacentor silvarum TaxID=543639 RepID=A0ACB8DC17_DERSI|nr:hypothetical protein HPB49_008998 [Dermacentor silvarum]
MPDDVFRQHFRLRKEIVRWLCDRTAISTAQVAEELGGVRSTVLSGSVGSDETIGVTQPAVSKCVRRVAEAIVHAGTRNKWEKAAVKEGYLRGGGIPDVIGCVDGSLIAIITPNGDNKAAYMCRKGFYALNSMFQRVADAVHAFVRFATQTLPSTLYDRVGITTSSSPAPSRFSGKSPRTGYESIDLYLGNTKSGAKRSAQSQH